MFVRTAFLFFICCSAASLFSEEAQSELFRNLPEEKVQVCLREPEFSEGTLKTTEGGVICTPDLRLQAKNITYKRKMGTNLIEAEGNLMLEWGDSIFIGKRLEYNLLSKTGKIYCGRTGLEPWFFGGDEIELKSNGDYVVKGGYATTSERETPGWHVLLRTSTVKERHLLSAKDVSVRWRQIPLFWLPSLHADLDTVFDSPVRYNVRWGGKQGPRVGMTYELFSWRRWKSLLRADYRLRRGPGAGIETEYHSLNHKETFHTVNYVAKDSIKKGTNPVDEGDGVTLESITFKPEWRYRLQGVYENTLCTDRLDVRFSYDKLSDQDMATDYSDKNFDLETAKPTELSTRYQEENSLHLLDVVLRINHFQTMRQQLPTIRSSLRPLNLASSGVILENEVRVSYQEFEYSHDLSEVKDYESSRVELANRAYRPLTFGNLSLLPELGSRLIFYGKSPKEGDESAKWLFVGLLSCEANTHFHRLFSNKKHVIKPYARYDYYIYPTTNPTEHYIFDYNDGWFRLNMLRAGIKQNLFIKTKDGGMFRAFTADLHYNAFFETSTILKVIPKLYANITYYPSPYLKYIFGTAWDTERSEWDHFNARTEVTLSEDIAIAAEYRHRSAFSWRKADQTKFVIDSFRSTSSLRASQMSDRRDTLLLHFFYRFYPDWALECQSRHGWNREKEEPSYNEMEITLHGTISSAWHLKFSYQHREDDPHRYTMGISMGIQRPNQRCLQKQIPCLEF